jgi:hypothetical protein
VKTKAIMAAKEAANRIKLGEDWARVLFDAIWEVIEKEWPVGLDGR